MTIEGELCGLPDFDLDNVYVVDYHIESLLAWARETGLDALRMDTAKHIAVLTFVRRGTRAALR